MATFLNINSNGFQYNGEEVNFIDRFVDRSGIHDIINGRHHVDFEPTKSRATRAQAAAVKALIDEDKFSEQEKFKMEQYRLNDEYLGHRFYSFEKDATRRMVEDKIRMSNW